LIEGEKGGPNWVWGKKRQKGENRGRGYGGNHHPPNTKFRMTQFGKRNK